MPDFISITASGFDRPWDGDYMLTFPDKWKHESGDYWIYTDGRFFYLSDSRYLYYIPRSKARIKFPEHFDPTGNYAGLGGEPNGVLS